ncbi:MAG: ATP-binding domain-containing protein, partial [Candidatus Omnitrophota bacterium]
KGGRIACKQGVWETTNRDGDTEVLKRSPFLQAREGMFALRKYILDNDPARHFSELIFGYAVVMPDIDFGERSTEWEPWQVIDRQALNKTISKPILRLVSAQNKLLSKSNNASFTPEILREIQQMIRPDFDRVVSRSVQIDESEERILRLTEEQFTAIDLMSENKRCFFEGAAGTGKTVLALEYARRSVLAGKKTLLICFNRLLGEWLEKQSMQFVNGKNLSAGRYYKKLRERIMTSAYSHKFREAEQQGDTQELFDIAYPQYGKLVFEAKADLYDLIVIDEAQDLLKPGVLEVLNLWLKEGLKDGSWVIFGDFHRQAIFAATSGEEIKGNLIRYSSHFAKAKLTVNCRNTRNISEETVLLSGFSAPPYRMGQVAGLPVDYHYYRTAEEQCGELANIIQDLLSGGVSPKDIVILSRFKLVNSGVANIDGRGWFRIVENDSLMSQKSGENIIRFVTVQAFKGMESPVVILCDVDRIVDGEPQALLYVAMSRARSQLFMLVEKQLETAIVENFRRKLLEGWGRDA